MNLLRKHKTKLTGALLVAAGSIQALSPQVQALVSPKAFAVFTIVIGGLVAVLGFLNSQVEDLGEESGV